MTQKSRLDLELVLSDLPDQRDRCVERLQKVLAKPYRDSRDFPRTVHLSGRIHHLAAAGLPETRLANRTNETSQQNRIDCSRSGRVVAPLYGLVSSGINRLVCGLLSSGQPADSEAEWLKICPTPAPAIFSDQTGQVSGCCCWVVRDDH